LLELVNYLSACKSSDKIMIRLLVGELLSQSMQLANINKSVNSPPELTQKLQNFPNYYTFRAFIYAKYYIRHTVNEELLKAASCEVSIEYINWAAGLYQPPSSKSKNSQTLT